MDEKEFKELKKLVKENNKMLHRMRRSMALSSIIRSLYWIFVIGSAIGAYYYLQPFIDKAGGGLNTLFSGFEALQNVGDIDSLFTN